MNHTENYKALKGQLEWYKKNYNEVCEVVYRISDALIPGYFVSDSCGGTQCCEILAEEIIDKFAPKKKADSKFMDWLKKIFVKGE